jgi:hypothetical protein
MPMNDEDGAENSSRLRIRSCSIVVRLLFCCSNQRRSSSSSSSLSLACSFCFVQQNDDAVLKSKVEWRHELRVTLPDGAHTTLAAQASDSAAALVQKLLAAAKASFARCLYVRVCVYPVDLDRRSRFASSTPRRR